jgi:hypothetical protein
MVQPESPLLLALQMFYLIAEQARARRRLNLDAKKHTTTLSPSIHHSAGSFPIILLLIGTEQF